MSSVQPSASLVQPQVARINYILPDVETKKIGPIGMIRAILDGQWTYTQARAPIHIMATSKSSGERLMTIGRDVLLDNVAIEYAIICLDPGVSFIIHMGSRLGFSRDCLGYHEQNCAPIGQHDLPIGLLYTNLKYETRNVQVYAICGPNLSMSYRVCAHGATPYSYCTIANIMETYGFYSSRERTDYFDQNRRFCKLSEFDLDDRCARRNCCAISPMELCPVTRSPRTSSRLSATVTRLWSPPLESEGSPILHLLHSEYNYGAP